MPPLAIEFPPSSAEWTFFVATAVILLGPLLVERYGLPGIVGVILGPIIIAVTIALVDIWRRRTREGQSAEVGLRGERKALV